MSKNYIESYSSDELRKMQRDGLSGTDWQRLAAMTDKDIDTSDIPELDENFWKDAELVSRRNKTSTTIRLDTDVLNWFKDQGQGWQTRINRVLQTYYNSHHN